MLSRLSRLALLLVLLLVLPTVSRAQLGDEIPLDGDPFDTPPIFGITGGPVVSWFDGIWTLPDTFRDTVVPGNPRDGVRPGWGWSIAVDYIPAPRYTVIGGSARFQHLTAEWSEISPVARLTYPSLPGRDSTDNTTHASYSVDLVSLEVWAGVPVLNFDRGWLLIIAEVDVSMVTGSRLRETLDGADQTLAPSYLTEDDGRRVVFYDDRIPGQASVMLGPCLGVRAEYRFESGHGISLEALYSYPLTSVGSEMHVSSLRLGLGLWRLL